MSAKQAIAADRVFDGTVVHRDAAVVIDGGTIVGVVPRGELPVEPNFPQGPCQSASDQKSVDRQRGGASAEEKKGR